jgi:hypothetical protein
MFVADYQFQPMKRPVVIVVAIALVLAGCVLAIILAVGHPKISMRVVEYQKWPHGAILRLTNGSGITIRYLAEPNGTPRGGPLLRVHKTTNGWTAVSVVLKSVTVYNATTGITSEQFFLMDPAAPPKIGEPIPVLISPELKPGQSVDFYIRLEPGDPPLRIGSFCLVPESRLALKLRPWLALIKQWCHIKTTGFGQAAPGRVEVWCPDSLSVSASGEPGAPRENRTAGP